MRKLRCIFRQKIDLLGRPNWFGALTWYNGLRLSGPVYVSESVCVMHIVHSILMCNCTREYLTGFYTKDIFSPIWEPISCRFVPEDGYTAWSLNVGVQWDLQYARWRYWLDTTKYGDDVISAEFAVLDKNHSTAIFGWEQRFRHRRACV